MELFFNQIYEYEKEVVSNFTVFKYTCAVISYKNYAGCQREIHCRYENLRFDMLMKYGWFFRRKMAKLQLVHPHRVFATIITRQKTKAEEDAFYLKKLKGKITSAKGKITQAKNQMIKIEKNWNQLFSIEEDERYKKAKSKIFTKQQSLSKMQTEYDNLVQLVQ